ncbi:MAG: NADH-quinone oxidoreductase subunit N [Acidobacteria bacterium]|nr:NADH-quinone oxidoreductase subunit N [Acidobacteriota bacterium]
MPMTMPAVDWGALAPFLWLCAGGLVTVLLAVAPKPVREASGWAALVAIALAGVSVRTLWFEPRVAFGGMVAADRLALAFDMIFLATGALAILLAMSALRREGVDHGEYYALVLFALAGMTMMAGSANLLVLFLGLEILSLPLYIMSAFTRTRERSLEASMKYFLMGAFSTGFTLYGMALLYGATGTLDLRAMAGSAAAPGHHAMLLVGVALTLIGFLFKIAAVPFHFWLPDVYQGAPTFVTGFMIAGTKAAAFATLLRILTTAFWGGAPSVPWAGMLSIVAVLTMTLGNVVALAQNNIKRMLAYSSIAHAGYLLVAVVCRTEAGVSGVVFYLASYLFINVGAFVVVHLVEHTREGDEVGELLQAYAGLGKREPWAAAAMAVFMFALTGMPLTSGFVGKFLIFKAAIDSNLYALAILGVLNSVVSAAYYLRVIVYMYFREPATEPQPLRSPLPATLALAGSVLGVFYLGLAPAAITALVERLF